MTDKLIYLDNSATTCLSEAAIAALNAAVGYFGNPSSLHAAGLSAEKIITSARKSITATFGFHAAPENIIFTASGSEANNLALFGTATAKNRKRANKIISSDSEHPSVNEALNRLAEQGFEVVKLKTSGGAIDRDEFIAALDERVYMVSVMSVNNETGAVYDVPGLFAAAKAYNPSIITHTDAVQAYMKMKIEPEKIHADLVSVSGHKIHAPKGVGALYVSPQIIKTKNLIPYIVGGGQENGFRSGTENTLGIAAFGAAAADGWMNFAKNAEKLGELNAYALQKLSECPEIKINRPATAANHIISITLPDIKSETMLNRLSSKGICVSSGSACSAHSKKLSRVLLAYGLSEKEADSTLRVSIDEYNEKSDIDALVSALSEAIGTLARIKR